jgi:RHS repeat-associated protein
MLYDGDGRRLTSTFHSVIPRLDRGIQSQQGKVTEYTFNGLDPVAVYEGSKFENLYYASTLRQAQGSGQAQIVVTDYYASPNTKNGKAQTLHYDALGSVVGKTQENGKADKNFEYSSYGVPSTLRQAQGSGQATGNLYQFSYTGQMQNTHSGLYEFYARTYDPATGTWLQQDVYRGEIMDPMSLHRYMYVGNSPVNFRDWYGYLGNCAFYDPVCNFNYVQDNGVQSSLNEVQDSYNAAWGVGSKGFNVGFQYTKDTNLQLQGMQEAVNILSDPQGFASGVGAFASDGIATYARLWTYGAEYLNPFGPLMIYGHLSNNQCLNNVFGGWTGFWDDRREGIGNTQYTFENWLGVVNWKHTEAYTNQSFPQNLFAGLSHLDRYEEASTSEKTYIIANFGIEVGAFFEAIKGGLNLTRNVRGTNVVDNSANLFPKNQIDEIINSANSPYNDQITSGVRALQKKIGHAEAGGYTSAFKGVTPNQTNVNSLIDDILENPTYTYEGDNVIDVYNSAGQGVRINKADNSFNTFLEWQLKSQ